MVSVSSWWVGLNIFLKFANGDVAVVVQFGERLPHPQGREAGVWVLVPALLRSLCNGCENLPKHSGECKPHELLMRMQAEAQWKVLPGGNGVGCAELASAGRRKPPSSFPQSWDLWAPGRRREDGTLQRFLGQKIHRCAVFLWKKSSF